MNRLKFVLMNQEILNKILLGDCLDLLPKVETCSIDMILADLPYGVSENKWDIIIPLEPLWKEYLRVIKDNGAIVLSAVQPFASMLVMSQPNLFRYDWIWLKTIPSNNMNANIQPLRSHEHILVFYKNQPTFNQQFRTGKPYKINRKITFKGEGYGTQRDNTRETNGELHPISTIEFSNPRVEDGHPTQKPVELYEYLIRTYTNEGDTVLDNCIGSGTTAVASIRTNRNYIGMEKDENYYKMAFERLSRETPFVLF
jgi:site-specific DNA-methyltransferase (adenine-specific)